LDSLLLHFFYDELEKLAGGDSRSQHNYYLRNRNKILQQQRQYRAKNAPMISKKQKVYRSKVKSGMIRQRQRISTGASYTYGGYR
jgi:hypothetical protein